MTEDGKPQKRLARKTTSKHWIERGPLAPWMHAYLQWLAGHPEATLSRAMINGERVGRRFPSTIERSVMVNKLARRKIPVTSIQVLERRPDSVAYFEKLRSDAQFLAKEIARKSIAKNLEVRDLALDRASGKIEMPDGSVTYGTMDIKAIETFTRPFVDMAFPKKAEAETVSPRITINIGAGSPETKALLARVLGEEDIPEIEYEIIPPKRIEGDSEDDILV